MLSYTLSGLVHLDPKKLQEPEKVLFDTLLYLNPLLTF